MDLIREYGGFDENKGLGIGLGNMEKGLVDLIREYG